MRPPLLLASACLLLLIQCLTFPRTRFVEDEGWNSDVSMTWMREGRLRMSSFPADLSYRVDARPPLLALAIGETFRWLGAGVLQARLSSILAGVGVVIVAYFLGMEWGGVWAAWVAALLMACDNLLLITARSARPEPHTTLFACLGILLYYVSRRKDSVVVEFSGGGFDRDRHQFPPAGYRLRFGGRRRCCCWNSGARRCGHAAPGRTCWGWWSRSRRTGCGWLRTVCIAPAFAPPTCAARWDPLSGSGWPERRCGSPISWGWAASGFPCLSTFPTGCTLR